MESRKLLTRAQAAEYVTEHVGPLSAHTLANLASRKEGPPIAAYWGRLPMYEPDALMAWAIKRLKSSAGAPEAA